MSAANQAAAAAVCDPILVDDAAPDVEAPKTPNRADQAPSDESPNKLSRSAEGEPSNLGLLEFMRRWQSTRVGWLAKILERVDETEKRSVSLEKAIGYRMDALEVRLEQSSANLSAATAETKKLAEQLQKQQKQLECDQDGPEARGGHPPREQGGLRGECDGSGFPTKGDDGGRDSIGSSVKTMSPSFRRPGAGHRGHRRLQAGHPQGWHPLNVGLSEGQLARLPQRRHGGRPALLSRLGLAHPLSVCNVIAIFGCSLPPAQLLRDHGERPVHALRLPAGAAGHPRPQQEAHESGGHDKDCLERHLQIGTYQTICWRSSTIVIRGNRVCTIRHNSTEGTTTTTFLHDWWNPHFREPASVIEDATRSALVAI